MGVHGGLTRAAVKYGSASTDLWGERQSLVGGKAITRCCEVQQRQHGLVGGKAITGGGFIQRKGKQHRVWRYFQLAAVASSVHASHFHYLFLFRLRKVLSLSALSRILFNEMSTSAPAVVSLSGTNPFLASIKYFSK